MVLNVKTLIEKLYTVINHCTIVDYYLSVNILILKAPVTIAADDNFCDFFLIFRPK